MKKFLMHMAGLVLLVTWGAGAGAQELTCDESLAIIQRMMDSFPSGRWVERGVLKTDHTRSQNDGQGVLVERITSYVEPGRLRQEFEVVSQTGKMDVSDAKVPAEVKNALNSAKKLGIISPPPTKRTTLMEEGRFVTYASAPFHSATIDESGRFQYQQYSLFLSAGLFQKQGFLSPENLISEMNGNSQLWEYEWANGERAIPVRVTTTKKSKSSLEVDNFRYQLASDETKPEDFRVEFAYGAGVEYLPPPNGSEPQSIVYVHNPAIDVQALIARRLQFVLSPQERKNCATAILNAVEEKFGVAFGDTSGIVHLADANQVPGKRPVGTTSAIEIRDLVRSKGLCSEIVRTDIEHLAALGNDTMAVLHLPNREHFTIFVGVYRQKDVWVSQSDTRKCLYILDRTDLDAWKGTAILISSKPIPVAPSSGNT